MKILCVGDIHLGRQPSRLPARLLEYPGARALGPTGAWDRTVDFATKARVDACFWLAMSSIRRMTSTKLTVT